MPVGRLRGLLRISDPVRSGSLRQGRARDRNSVPVMLLLRRGCHLVEWIFELARLDHGSANRLP